MRLQAKLLLFVAPCAILSLVLIYLFTNAGLHDRTSRQLLTEMNLALDLADLQFRQFITTANADASLLAGMPSERAHASASEQNSQARAPQEQLRNAVARFQEAHSEHLALSTAFESISREIFWSAVDDKGQIILHADRSLIGNVDRELMQDASTVSASGKIDNALYRGVPTIITRKPLTDNLSMVALLPESAVQDSYVEFSDQLTIVSAVSTFMGIATFFTLLRFFVMRPLIRLRHLAMSIGREPPDNTHACMDVQRRDEIGDLSRAFKETSERLQLSMSELQDSHSQIETLAYRDALTGLANRRLFNQMAELRIQEAREQGHGLCVLFLDLDDFKRINDTQGHKAGDRLLETVSERLLNCLAETAPGADCVHTSRPENNTVARMGGDEFIVLLPHSDNGNEGEAAAARILDAMARPISLNEHEFVVSTSIGIAQYPTHADNVDDLVKCADAAMYEAKRLNKNNYRTYGSDIQQMLEDRLQLELDLRQAMPKEQLSLVYQPQYCVDGMEIVGAEALLRWQHPDRGMIPPDVFIAIAEERDLIDKIGAWVLDEACRQWKQWQNSGIELKHIAVNVSARQFACGNIQQLVDEVLKRYDMPASALELELTESCIIESPQEMFNTLSDLRASGIAIAMDDFGTGYSSLSTIATMPVDTLKIDRSFMTNLTIGSPNEKIVSAILMLADGLKMQVVAEGVEQQSELDFLKSRQCDMAQGYYLARPLNVHDMTALLHEQADRRFRQTG
ncbi:putative bifunctional diguanylate cyclase/phosphodiesterase [Granulosicoccus sp. 3-233]|uniref:putative bifunctional diguanylate cyclase/phosphodiesterase n=1 Tax=Granulosicoccus sp. 3-233 TaxID=3417969 RepID=UPI003D332B8A